MAPGRAGPWGPMENLGLEYLESTTAAPYIHLLPIVRDAGRAWNDIPPRHNADAAPSARPGQHTPRAGGGHRAHGTHGVPPPRAPGAGRHTDRPSAFRWYS